MRIQATATLMMLIMLAACSSPETSQQDEGALARVYDRILVIND